MDNIKEMLLYNKEFVKQKKYEKYISQKKPAKKIAVLSCMDARLTELLPAALDFKNGDIKIIKNAGAVVTHPFGSVMRSLLVAIYELGVESILVIGHSDCGMQGLCPSKMIAKMKKRGIGDDKIKFIKNCGIDFEKWLTGFDKVEQSVLETVSIIKHHPLIPDDVSVFGFLIDPLTGELTKL